MKKMFTISPGLKDKKVVILGTGQSSLLLFSVMLQNNIYVDAFLDKNNSCENRLKIMNKPIISEKEACNIREQIVIAATGESVLKEAEELEKKGYEIFFDFNFTAYEGDCVFLQGEKIC